MLNDLAKTIHENAKNKGFYDTEKNTGESLCLIHSEVSEALEADRIGKYQKSHDYKIKDLVEFEPNIFKVFFENDVKDTFEDELADVIIRVLDFCAYKNIDIENHIKAKIRFNSTRGYKHGKIY